MNDYEETSKIAESIEREVEFQDKEFTKEFKKKVDELKNARKPNISIVGPTNTGKSELVNSLFGYDVVKTENIPGCTKENFIKEQKYGVIIMDTPGYGAGDEKDRILAKKAMKAADVVIVVYNVMVGVTRAGLEPLKDAQELGKETIIILNQIDLADFNQIDEQMDFLEEHGFEDIVKVSALTGAGLPTLINKIYEKIPEECKTDFLRSVFAEKEEAEKRVKKAIEEKLRILEEKKKKGENLSDSEKTFVKNTDVFVKKTKERLNKISEGKSKLTNKYIFAAGAAGGAIGALPLPGADIVPLNALQACLIVKIGLIYDLQLNSKTILTLLGTLGIDELFKSIFRQLIKIIPVAGSIIGAFVAAVGTITVGFVAKIILSRKDLTFDKETFKMIHEQIYPEIKRALQSYKSEINKLGKEDDKAGMEKTFEDFVHEENFES